MDRDDDGNVRVVELTCRQLLCIPRVLLNKEKILQPRNSKVRIRDFSTNGGSSRHDNINFPCVICGGTAGGNCVVGRGGEDNLFSPSNMAYIQSLTVTVQDDEDELLCQDLTGLVFCPSCMKAVKEVLSVRNQLQDMELRIRSVVRLRRGGLSSGVDKGRNPTTEQPRRNQNHPTSSSWDGHEGVEDMDIVLHVLKEEGGDPAGVEKCEDKVEAESIRPGIDFRTAESGHELPQASPLSSSSCPVCRKPFASSERLQQHLYRSCGQEEAKRIELRRRNAECNRRYRALNPFMCSVCGKRFPSSLLQTQHGQTVCHPGTEQWKQYVKSKQESQRKYIMKRKMASSANNDKKRVQSQNPALDRPFILDLFDPSSPPLQRKGCTKGGGGSGPNNQMSQHPTSPNTLLEFGGASETTHNSKRRTIPARKSREKAEALVKSWTEQERSTFPIYEN